MIDAQDAARDPAIPEPDPLIYELDADELEPGALDEMIPTVDVDTASRGHRATVKARTQHGVRESGGPNRGVPHRRYVQYFGRNIPPSPWCAFFVSWAFAETGSRPPWSNPGYVPSIYSWARANGKLVTKPSHGDMFGLGGSHMGLVAGANPREIFTIEGNFGDKVASRLIRWQGAGLWFARW